MDIGEEALEMTQNSGNLGMESLENFIPIRTNLFFNLNWLR